MHKAFGLGREELWDGIRSFTVVKEHPVYFMLGMIIKSDCSSSSFVCLSLVVSADPLWVFTKVQSRVTAAFQSLLHVSLFSGFSLNV